VEAEETVKEKDLPMAGRPEPQVSCYHCLTRVTWSEQQPLRYDPETNTMVPIDLSPQASPEARARALTNALVRCPGSTQEDPHHLPLNYGRYGPPVVVGLIGASSSGKTHLLSAMIQSLAEGQLHEYGIIAHPVDPHAHAEFLARCVDPLFLEGRELEPTDERVVRFADAFVLRESGGEPRVVALFDVSGEELTGLHESKQFLYLADALVFVADPMIFADPAKRSMGDPAFNRVLDLLQQNRGNADVGAVHAATVLSKADLLRMEDPVASWLGVPVGTDNELIVRESEDVYAYLLACQARPWLRPFQECHRATLHVASATGGSSTGDPVTGDPSGRFSRGVRPRRVLGPLLSVLAMTGVLTRPGAEAIGR
jgi:hypothetical protein